MHNRTIKKVAILGSGIMGAQIACHFANIGVQALLLDMAFKESTEAHEASGKPGIPSSHKNRIAREGLEKAIKTNPAPLFDKSFASRITVGNFDDDMPKIQECDWVIEVVVERLDVKHIIFEQVDKFRKPGSLVSSNTSGIPIHFMLKGRSEDFKRHFCGTHFLIPKVFTTP